MRQYQIALLFFTAAFSVAAFAVNFLIEQRMPSQWEPFRDEVSAKPNSVKVFFLNSKVGAKELVPNAVEELYCDITYPVERSVSLISKDDNGYPGELAYLSLSELLKGPTEAEKDKGFFTSINPAVKIRKIVIERGLALVDFNQELERDVSGSCKIQAIRSQITETLMQFPEIKNVIISVEGRSEEVLQP